MILVHRREGNVSQEFPETLYGNNALAFAKMHLQVVIDRVRSSWKALYVCPETGQFWELSTDGLYDTTVLRRISADDSVAKYGPLPLPNKKPG